MLIETTCMFEVFGPVQEPQRLVWGTFKMQAKQNCKKIFMAHFQIIVSMMVWCYPTRHLNE